MSVFDFEATRLEGGALSLADFRGKVLLIVNTASECGFTPQYAGLQKLQERYGPRGFTVIGFPCNQFGGQEPGSADQIGAFCRRNYGVSFPMAGKVDVKGETAHPLFRHLTTALPGIFGTRAVKWNFTKFLVDRQGRAVARFAPRTKPEDLGPRIEALL